MFTDEAVQRQRRLLASWMCMCFVWVSFMSNYLTLAFQQKPVVNSYLPKSILADEPLDEVKTPEFAATANIKPLPIEDMAYEDHDPYEEEVAIVEAEDGNIYVSADFVASRQDVAEGDTRGTFFIERKPAIEYTDEDLYYLANGIYSEAGICSDMECYRVGQVMLDRMLDTTGRFPENTIKGVLYATGQFGCVGGRAWKHGPDERELQIAKDLLEGARVFPEDIVWFNNSHDYGYLYCHPEYHYFSGYEDHGGDLANQQATTVKEETFEEKAELAEEFLEKAELAEEFLEKAELAEEFLENAEEVIIAEGIFDEVEQLAEADAVTEVPADNQDEVIDESDSNEEILIAMFTTTE